MKVIGVLLAIAGWLVPVTGLALAQSTVVRFTLSLLGVALAALGIFGVNQAHLKQAIWRR